MSFVSWKNSIPGMSSKSLTQDGKGNHHAGAQIDFFQETKDMTIFTYYTSEIGMNQELEYGGDDLHADYPGACTHPEHQSLGQKLMRHYVQTLLFQLLAGGTLLPVPLKVSIVESPDGVGRFHRDS